MKTLSAVRNICWNMAVALFRSHVNISENLHFGSGLNSFRSHVNLVLNPGPNGERFDRGYQRLYVL